jgi:hypothetical protein
MSIWTTITGDAKKVIGAIGHAMKFAEDFFGSQAGVAKLKTVESVVAEGLVLAGVPAPLVAAANAEFQTVVNAIVAWDKKLNGAILGNTPASPTTPTTPAA